MGILIKEALENRIISPRVVDVIPMKCRCGCDLEFSDSLRELKCTDGNCIYSVIYRAQSFVKKLNINLSDNDVENVVNELGIITPYQLMMLPDAYREDEELIRNIGITNIEEVIDNIEEAQSKEYRLDYIVSLCGIKTISKVAHKIFDGFCNIEEAYTEITTGQLSFLNERLGIKSQDSSILSLEIYEMLLKLREELIFGESRFNIKKYDKEVLNIAFVDNIEPFVNKSELIYKMNHKYNYKFNLVNVINSDTDILINNSESSGGKLRTARLINDRYVAELMNNGKLSLSSIGKFNGNNLKPIGQKIFIGTLEKVIERLDITLNE